MNTYAIATNVARRLEGKVALITGGGSGIGEMAARVFAKHGAKVVIADIGVEKAERVCQELGSDGSSSSFVRCDVTNESDVENAVNAAVSRHGKLDIMFNNAGIVSPPPKSASLVHDDLSEFKKVMDVNVIGVFLGTKHAARVMVPHRRGTIINTGSVASVVGGAAPHAYTCSKHAVLGLTRNTAVELGPHGIRVNCVSPYVVPTPMSLAFLGWNEEEYPGDLYSNLKGAVLGPQDVAEAALFLASDESKYISGHNLVVDGGYSIVNPMFCVFQE